MGISHETTRSVHSDAPRVSATHEFTIRSYSRTKGIGIGQTIQSANFTVDDREWNIGFYPDGYSIFDWRDPAVFAQTVRVPIWPFQTTVQFQLIDPRNGGKVVYGVDLGVITFDYKGHIRGIRRFMSRKQLEGAELGALHDDSITLRCTIGVLKPEARLLPAHAVQVPPVPPSCFAQNAARFLASRRAPFDVKFDVDGVVLEAHRLVLASQSPWFDTLLYGHWSETSGTRAVEIRGTSPEVFKAVLHYIYNDQLPDGATADEATTRQLFVAADMYLLERLKKMCASRLCSFIQDGTVDSIMELAEAHSCVQLQQACKSYLTSRKNRLPIEQSSYSNYTY